MPTRKPRRAKMTKLAVRVPSITKREIESLAAMLQIPAWDIIDRALVTMVKGMRPADRRRLRRLSAS